MNRGLFRGATEGRESPLQAAVIAVPIANRFRLGAVLGFLAAGIAIGPHGLGLVADLASTLRVAELGVVFLLFLLGLELTPQRLWAMRRIVFGAGGLQVALTAPLGAPRQPDGRRAGLSSAARSA